MFFCVSCSAEEALTIGSARYGQINVAVSAELAQEIAKRGLAPFAAPYTIESSGGNWAYSRLKCPPTEAAILAELEATRARCRAVDDYLTAVERHIPATAPKTDGLPQEWLRRLRLAEKALEMRAAWQAGGDALPQVLREASIPGLRSPEALALAFGPDAADVVAELEARRARETAAENERKAAAEADRARRQKEQEERDAALRATQASQRAALADILAGRDPDGLVLERLAAGVLPEGELWERVQEWVAIELNGSVLGDRAPLRHDCDEDRVDEDTNPVTGLDAETFRQVKVFKTRLAALAATLPEGLTLEGEVLRWDFRCGYCDEEGRRLFFRTKLCGAGTLSWRTDLAL